MLPSYITLFSTDFRFLREWLIVDCEIAHLYLRVGVGFFALGQLQHRPSGRLPAMLGCHQHHGNLMYVILVIHAYYGVGT
jgi:hypothetical protein